MIEWIKTHERSNTHDQLPQDGSLFLTIWEESIYLCQFDSDENSFYQVSHPALGERCWKLDGDPEGKITHYALLSKPQDY